jgi:hypothetical protein
VLDASIDGGAGEMEAGTAVSAGPSRLATLAGAVFGGGGGGGGGCGGVGVAVRGARRARRGSTAMV